MGSKNQKNILIVDDNPEIHLDFKRIFNKQNLNHIKNFSKILFNKKENKKQKSITFPDLKIDSAYQGKEAVELVKKSLQTNEPYAMAFVDIRMPPGWDGINTVKELWKIDPDVQIVICTAYSDYSWQDMFEELNKSENFLILKKPFETVEVRQLLASLTKKWEYKRRIRDKVINLESLVLERTEEVRHALGLAEDANKLKNEFLSNVSYELRVPLNSIIGFTELMYHEKVDKKNLKEYYADILSSGKYLLQMIEDILEMSKLESSKLEFRPQKINLHQLFDEIKDMFLPAIKEKKLKWDSTIDSSLIHIMSDPVKLKQVIHHYISNAIKFSSEGGQIEVRAHLVEDSLQIEVTDQGIGIREEDIKKLFTPFQQLDLSMSKKYHGTGLGLALVKRIIEHQGGTVGVKSTYGKGSTFYLRLPMVRS